MANNLHVARTVLKSLVTREVANFNSMAFSPLTVVASTDDGRSQFQWNVDSTNVNKDGSLHYGCISALIDFSTSVTMMSMKCGKIPMSVNIDFRYMGTIREGETADIFTEVKKLGDSISVLEAKLCHSETGDLIATGKHTVAHRKNVPSSYLNLKQTDDPE